MCLVLKVGVGLFFGLSFFEMIGFLDNMASSAISHMDVTRRKLHNPRIYRSKKQKLNKNKIAILIMTRHQ